MWEVPSQDSIWLSVDAAWELPFLTSPCSISLTKILLLKISIALREVVFWIRLHLSLRRRDSVCRSSGFMSGLIRIPLGSVLVLDSRIDMTMALLSLGLGCLDSSWYLPSLCRSLIDIGLMFSLTLVMISITPLKSWPKWSFLGVPLSHSLIP